MSEVIMRTSIESNKNFEIQYEIKLKQLEKIQIENNKLNTQIKQKDYKPNQYSKKDLIKS